MKNLWLVVAALLVFVAPASATRKRGKRTFDWRPGRYTLVSAADVSERHPTPTPTPGLWLRTTTVPWRLGRFSFVSAADVSKRHPIPTPTPDLQRAKRAVSWRPGRFSLVSSVDISERHPMPTLHPIFLDEVVVKEPDVKYNQPLFELLQGLIDKNWDLEETAGETEDQQRPF